MILVRDFARGEDFVEGGSSGVEAEVVFGAAVEIDFEAGEPRSAGQSERAVALPKRCVGRETEDAAEDAGTRARRSATIAGKEERKLFDERGAVRAYGREKLGMREGQMKRAVAAHGNAGDGAVGAAGTDAVVRSDERKKFTQEKILVAALAVEGIDVKAGAAGRSGDQEFLEQTFVAEIFDEIPGTGVKKGLLVVTETVEKIENGEAAGFVGIKAGREKNAVRNGVRKDFAGDGVAFDAAGSSVRIRDVKKVQEGQEVKEKRNSSHRCERNS